ncbi:MAG TPA: hypothetical protein VGK67_27175 [Myxococcales bacterium]|jgi:hypothetical protein
MIRAPSALVLALCVGCFDPTGDDSPRDASMPDVGVAVDAGLTCQACRRDCTGRACGDDGCGGSCGKCGVGQVCRVDRCVDEVDPCASLDCGPNGKGGSCGACPGGYTCNAAGYCIPDGGCASLPAGGACVAGSVTFCEGGAVSRKFCPYRNCQVDPASGKAGCAPATCIPNCFGRGCGADGCGGICGTCLSDEKCDTDLGACVPPCSRVSSVGMCQGTALIACFGGRMEKTSCLAFDQICDPHGCSSAACRPVDRMTPCMGVSAAGFCHGDTLYFCSGQAVVTQRCADDGQRCARVAADRYACVK